MPQDQQPTREVNAIIARASEEPSLTTRSIPVEAPLAIEVNDAIVAHLMRTPGNDIELAIGFCYTEGILNGMQDVESVQLCPDDAGKVTVRTTKAVATRAPVMLTSACAGGRIGESFELPEPLPAGDLTIQAEALLGAAGRLRESQTIRQAAGAVHAAAILSADGQPLVAREDVGRHNAIDKAIGQCVYQGCGLKNSILLSTGRASSEMVLKAARARIPVAASRSGSTSLGVELAQLLGVTLVCYVKSAQMTILTHGDRIEQAPSLDSSRETGV
ncbi:MAG TPA: formate dehydrogenase accessory sulfurtransferase FdhD [Armatimonadota bacterium]|nr:formate dehydrogenase accessory sulfurtransferase FdhD [Armatimonadota bacterium]